MAGPPIFDPKEALKERVARMRAGWEPDQANIDWMKAASEQMGLDFNTLTEGTRTGSILSGGVAGLTMGWNDEMRGALAAVLPAGKTYEEARDESRMQHDTRRFANPVAYTAGEVGGGVAGAFVPIAGQLGTAGRAVTTGGRLARAAAVGGGLGALDAYGRQEDNNNPFTGEVALGIGIGAVAGVAGDALGAIFNRSRSAGDAAELELRKLMQQSGLSADEVVAAIARGDGPLTTQNATFLMEARIAMDRASAGVKSGVADAAKDAAEGGRGAVANTMREALPDNLRGATGRSALVDAVTPDNLNAAYPAAHAADAAHTAARGGVPSELLDQVDRMAALKPDIIETINKNALGSHTFDPATGLRQDPRTFTPIVSMDDTGRAVWLRDPNASELFSINRSMGDATSSMYNPTAGTTRTADMARSMDDAQQTFRGMLTDAMPATDAVTTSVAQGKAMSEAYDAAIKGVRSPAAADEFLNLFAGMAPAQQNATRAAVADYVRDIASKARSGRTMQSYLPREAGEAIDPHMYKIIAEVFDENLDDIMRVVNRADGAEGLLSMISGNSNTAERMAGAARYAGNDQAEMVAQAAIQSGPVQAAWAMGGRLTGSVAKKLGIGEQKASLVLQALTTEDPALFQRILAGDETAFSTLNQLIQSGILGGAVSADNDRSLPMLQQ